MKAQVLISVLLLWEEYVRSATYPDCPQQNGPGAAIQFPHAKDCAKFVTCDWGREIIRDCSPGTLWNDAVKTCDHPGNVKCNTETTIFSTTPTRSHRTIPPIKTTTVAYGAKPTRHPSTNGGCPSVVDENHPVFLPHLDCERFYVCTLKGPIEARCNEGFHWSIRTTRCERPWEAWCVTSATPPMMNDGCPTVVVDPNNPVFLPHPDSTKIYICIPGVGRRELTCPEGHQWSTEGCIPGTDRNTSTFAAENTATTEIIIQSTSAGNADEPTEAVEYFTTDDYRT